MMIVAQYWTCNVMVIAVGGTVMCLRSNSFQCHIVKRWCYELYECGSKVRCPCWQFVLSLYRCHVLASSHAATVFDMIIAAHDRTCSVESAEVCQCVVEACQCMVWLIDRYFVEVVRLHFLPFVIGIFSYMSMESNKLLSCVFVVCAFFVSVLVYGVMCVAVQTDRLEE